MRPISAILLLIVLTSCLTNSNNEIIDEPIVIENDFYNKNKIKINGIPLKAFIDKYKPEREENGCSYYLFDTKQQIQSGSILCETMESTDIIFKNGKLESFILGSSWQWSSNSEPIPKGSKVTFDSTGLRVTRIDLNGNTTIDGTKIAKDTKIYLYPTNENNLAYFVPADDYINGDLPISGGFPVYQYENGTLARCTTSGSLEHNLKPGSDLFLYPNGRLHTVTSLKESTIDFITIPANSIISRYPNGNYKYLTTKDEISMHLTGLKGDIKANTKVYFDQGGKIVRFTLSELIKKGAKLEANTEVIKYIGGKPARIVLVDQVNHSIKSHTPIYYYENGKAMKITMNKLDEIEVFFDQNGIVVTDEEEIKKIMEKVSDIDNMYKSNDWAWNGYEKLYQFHEDKDF